MSSILEAMSDDFHKLMEEIESEAEAEGPVAEAELRELRREFSITSQLMTLRRDQKAMPEEGLEPPTRGL